ncbi:MAG: TonB-dependent receptor plug domain-containing protein [Desulfobacterales bacterium]|jgi:iron complex outermembrane receptor protein|nr:TonB-dependent receptor plug domain-containing protein [Desulfobacterales bacterium]
MKRMGILLLWLSCFSVMLVSSPKASEIQPDEGVQQLEDVLVKDKTGAPGISLTPARTLIEVDAFSSIGVPNSILDVLKTQAAIDFRGESDLDPGIDSIYLRGFESQRFVTALDNLTVQKTGGRKSTNIVDYSLLPAFLIDKIEILPGPHSAMYDGKAIGGVLNFISRAPRRRESIKPELNFSTGYSAYDTFISNTSVSGGITVFTYDLSYRKYETDGYLRNNEIDQDTVYGRFGVVLPSDGFVTISASYSDVDRLAPVHNPASDGTDYDPDYPQTIGGLFDPYQQPTWDSLSKNYRLNYEQSLPVGRLTLGAYYGRDNRDRAYYANRTATAKTHMDTDWWQQGGKIQDEIRWSSDHSTIVGYDAVRMYDDGLNDSKTKRIDKNGTFLQHRWQLLPSLDVKLGARYEDLNIWITNNGLVERHFDGFMPKSFATWKLDGLASWLRDSSLSAGVSRIWHGPDAHGIYNPQGRPLGLNLDPEHGIGYDLIFSRRLWRDIAFKIDYSFYEIEDFIASSVNVEQVDRKGVDLELGGYLTDALSFYLTYAWQDLKNKGDEVVGATNVDQRAEHRIGAGLRYALFENTELQLDYAYQSDEITEIWEDEILIGEQEIDAYHVVDFGVSQTLFKKAGWLSDGVVSVYVKNLFDEEYYNSTGYPAMDQTFGVSFSMKL